VTIVRIVHAEPRPGKMADGSVVIGQHLIVLADDAGHRALPLWLRVPEGKSLWWLTDRPADDDATLAGVLEESVARLLDAAGTTVTAVDIETASEDVPELRSDTVGARIELATAAGARQVLVSAGYGLALAAAARAPVRVADVVMDKHAVPVQGEDLLEPFLPPAGTPPGGGKAGRPQRHWRFEPRNMAFTDGLDLWELSGSFLGAGQPHRQDYSCTTEGQSVILAAEVPRPAGFAVLLQTIYADDYRGRTVTIRGQLRTTNLADHAGLHVATGRPTEPPGAHLRNRGSGSLTGPGSSDWTWHEVTTGVPSEAGVIRFGISLTGQGRVELRNAGLDLARPEDQE
jgi:hypothetical protein